MQYLKRVENLEHIKLLRDSCRLVILHLLMKERSKSRSSPEGVISQELASHSAWLHNFA
jgi:hypothetical protein